MKLRKTLRNKLFLIFFLFFFVAVRCSNVTSPQVATIEIPSSNSKMVLARGGNRTLTAIPKDDKGNALSGVNLNWSSDHPAVASVDGTIVKGLEIGTAKIIASAGGTLSSPIEVKVVSPHDGPFATTRTSPANQLANVELSPTIRISFNRQVDTSTINDSTYVLTGPTGKISGTIRYEAETWSLIFTPSSHLDRRTTYIAKITTGLKDELGNSLPDDFVWSFTTEGVNGAPVLVHYGAPYIYRTGMGAYNMAVGDLNRDGHLDMVVVNTEENFVSMLMGDGKGNLGPPIQIVTDAGTHGVAIADLNHDGWPDIVVANLKGGTISIILNKTAALGGTFQYAPPVNLLVGNHPSYIAIADFNGDSKLDLAVSDDVDISDHIDANDSASGMSLNPGAVNILPGNGDGTFGSPHRYPTHGLGTHTIVAGDLNQDGMIDLVASDRYSEDISIFIGDGQGNFSLAPAITFPRWVHSVVLGDLDQDGRLDIVAENREYVSVLLNQTPRGSITVQFAPMMHYQAGSGPAYSSIGDLNGDGFPDVAVANNGSGSVAIFLGDGTGFLSKPTFFYSGPGMHAAILGDFNEDGRLDVASGNQATDLASILINGEGDLFAPPVNLPTQTPPRALTAEDWDGDAKTDIAIASPIVNSFSTFLNLTPLGGSPVLRQETIYPLGGFPAWIDHTDLNGDGKEDLVLLQRDTNQVSFYLGDGLGHFAPAGSITVGSEPVSVALGDWNGDGKIDFAVLNSLSNDVTILKNNTALGSKNVTMIFQATLSVGPKHSEIDPATGLKITGRYTGDIVTFDFDHDGKADLAVITRDENQLTIFKGDGTSLFSKLNTISGFNAPTTLRIGEFTGDSEPDLAILNQGSREVWVIPGDGKGLFSTAPVKFTVDRGASTFLVGDFNADGIDDLAVATDRSAISVLLGRKGGGFATPQNISAGSVITGLAFLDLKGDGKKELIAIDEVGSQIIILGR